MRPLSSSAEVAKIVKSIKTMGALVEKDEVVTFKANMAEFLGDAQQKVSELERLMKETVDLCVDLGTWFAEQKARGASPAAPSPSCRQPPRRRRRRHHNLCHRHRHRHRHRLPLPPSPKSSS